MILITGASGSVGKAVLAEVARSGEKYRAMYRSKEDAAKAPAGTETVIADFRTRRASRRRCAASRAFIWSARRFRSWCNSKGT